MQRAILAILGITFLTTSAQAVTQVLNPVHDSYVDASEPDTNFDSLVLVSGSDAGLPARLHSYLRFQLPTSVTITKATLRIQYANCAATSNPTLEHDLFLIADDSWLETTLTWNNQPVEGPNTGADYFTAVGCPGGADFVGDVTAFVVQEAAGDGAISLMLRLDPETLPAGETQNVMLWTSRETAAPPELILTVIPNAPALGPGGNTGLAVLFVGLGGVLLGRFGKRSD